MASKLHRSPHTLFVLKEGAVIQLTESAASALRSAIVRAGTPVEGLRIAVQGGGCSGLQYMMGLVSQVEPGDLMFEDRGLRVDIDQPVCPCSAALPSISSSACKAPASLSTTHRPSRPAPAENLSLKENEP